uniref:Uncharacterized protein n=1 Tax=Nitzschia sp. NIES-3576 TaxID=2083273 RepID=A0A2Z5ZAD0_9STRA|nr:hypothetical protein Ycf89 [Nitzschia sp. NIES-3576]BBC77660.1 hypothetical protein Ycf89 [Nitzschia sp. NIES-3576]
MTTIGDFILLKLIWIIHKIFRIFSYFLGHPFNKGIKITHTFSDFSKPEHITLWPGIQPALKWTEIFFTPVPKMNLIKKYNQKKFYTSFFTFDYSNINFLPNLISKTFYTHFKIYNEIDSLRKLRKNLFLWPMTYAHMLDIRATSSWFARFNPFDFPWNYFCILIDPFENYITRFLPVELFQVSIEMPFLLLVFGFLADQANHLVYTLPYISSEIKPSGIFIRRKLKKVLMFSTIPILWCKFRIPNDIREFWYSKHFNIIQFLILIKKDLNIDILPDRLI